MVGQDPAVLARKLRSIDVADVRIALVSVGVGGDVFALAREVALALFTNPLAEQLTYLLGAHEAHVIEGKAFARHRVFVAIDAEAYVPALLGVADRAAVLRTTVSAELPAAEEVTADLFDTGTVGALDEHHVFGTRGGRSVFRSNGRARGDHRRPGRSFCVPLLSAPHTHALSLDGVYHNDGGRAVFTQVRAPSDAEVAEVVRRIKERVLRALERRGVLRDPVDARDPGEDEPMTSCGQLSLRIGTLGRVDEDGRVLPDDDEARFGKAGKRLCADIDGWSLHAAVTVHADDDVGRENLCRYVLRHPISLQRLSMTRDGRVAYRVKYPRGKRTHLLMEPVQFLARLASLIPPPRLPTALPGPIRPDSVAGVPKLGLATSAGGRLTSERRSVFLTAQHRGHGRLGWDEHRGHGRRRRCRRNRGLPKCRPRIARSVR